MADPNITRLCTKSDGLYKCPENRYCGNPSQYNLEKEQYVRDEAHIADLDYNIPNFDNIGSAVLTIFQCITLEGWVFITYRLMDATQPFLTAIFFCLLIVFGSFFLINLTLAVIWQQFQSTMEQEQSKKKPDDSAEKKKEQLKKITQFFQPSKNKQNQLIGSQELDIKQSQTALTNKPEGEIQQNQILETNEYERIQTTERNNKKEKVINNPQEAQEVWERNSNENQQEEMKLIEFKTEQIDQQLDTLLQNNGKKDFITEFSENQNIQENQSQDKSQNNYSKLEKQQDADLDANLQIETEHQEQDNEQIKIEEAPQEVDFVKIRAQQNKII